MTPEEAMVLAEQYPDAPDRAEVQGTQAPPVKEAAARGALQGFSLGFGDEGAAAIAALFPALDPDAAKGETIAQRYRAAREFYRRLNRSAEEAHPGTYLAGEIGGGLALPGAGARVGFKGLASPGLGGLTALGAASGAGHSEADDALDQLEDALIGGGASLAVGGAAAGLGKVGRRLLARGERIAGERAAHTVDSAIESARGTYGAQRQNMSRAIEVLLRAESTGALTPEQSARLATLKASPDWEETIRSVAQNYIEDVPGLAGAASSAKAHYQEMVKGRAGDIAREAERLKGGKEAARLLKERGKRYGRALLLGGGIGGAIGGPLGAAGGAGIALSLRPTVNAFGRLAAHQPSWLVREGALAEGLGETVGYYGPATARALEGAALTGSAPDGSLTYDEAMRLIDEFPDAE